VKIQLVEKLWHLTPNEKESEFRRTDHGAPGHGIVIMFGNGDKPQVISCGEEDGIARDCAH
jgi:hypothetical protein